MCKNPVTFTGIEILAAWQSSDCGRRFLILIPLSHRVKDFFLDSVQCGNFLINDLEEELMSTRGAGSGG